MGARGDHGGSGDLDLDLPAGRREEGRLVAVARLGKYKAFIQMLTVGAYVLPVTADIEWLTVGMLWFAVALTVVSGIDILRRGYQEGKA